MGAIVSRSPACDAAKSRWRSRSSWTTRGNICCGGRGGSSAHSRAARCSSSGSPRPSWRFRRRSPLRASCSAGSMSRRRARSRGRRRTCRSSEIFLAWGISTPIAIVGLRVGIRSAARRTGARPLPPPLRLRRRDEEPSPSPRRRRSAGRGGSSRSTTRRSRRSGFRPERDVSTASAPAPSRSAASSASPCSRSTRSPSARCARSSAWSCCALPTGAPHSTMERSTRTSTR